MKMAIRSSERVASAHVSAWVDRHAALMLAAALLAVAMDSPLPVLIAACVSFSGVVFENRRDLRLQRPFGGWANWVTAARLGLVISIGTSMVSAPRWLVLLMFALIVGLDTADGYVARRCGCATHFGAIFDRETDACFVLVAYLYFFLVGGTGTWILLPGVLPYAYRVLTLQFRSSPRRESKERFAAILAGVNYVLLLAAVALAPPARNSVLAFSCAIVIASFAQSSIRFLRHGHPIP